MSSVRRNMNSRFIAYSVLMLVNVIKVIESNIQYDFRVELQEYVNEFNLKYRPDSIDTPYCCCAQRDKCFSSITDTNLNTSSCKTQCTLRFTLMANLSWFEGIGSKEEGMITSNNFVSSFHPVFSFFNFDCLSNGKNFFPNLNKYPQFTFPFKIPSPNDFNNISLMVKIEEGNDDIDVEFVDIVDVPIATKGFVDSNKYIGEHGIATITLGYSFIAIIDDSSSSIHQQDTINPTASPTVSFTIPSCLWPNETIRFTKTVTMSVTEQDTISPTASPTVSFTIPSCLCPNETIPFTKTVTMSVTEQAPLTNSTTLVTSCEEYPTMPSTLARPITCSPTEVNITSSNETSTAMIIITTTAEEMYTLSTFVLSNSMDCECSTSSVLIPVYVALFSITTAMLLVAIFIFIAIVCWKQRKKKSSDGDKQEADHIVDNILYATPSSNKDVHEKNSKQEGLEDEGASQGVMNVLYAIPTHLTEKLHPEEESSTFKPTTIVTEGGKYLELSDAIIAPTPYLCPKSTPT